MPSRFQYPYICTIVKLDPSSHQHPDSYRCSPTLENSFTDPSRQGQSRGQGKEAKSRGHLKLSFSARLQHRGPGTFYIQMPIMAGSCVNHITPLILLDLGAAISSLYICISF